MTKPIQKACTIAFVGAFVAASSFGQQTKEEPVSPFERQLKQAEVVQPTKPQPNALDTFEFNGFTKMGGKLRVSVFDTKNRRNYWLEQGGPAQDGIVLNRFDPSNKSVSIARGTVSKTLQLKDASIVSLKITPTTTSTMPADASAQQNEIASQSPQRVQESDDEVRERMRRMAEEIRRRRAQRRQAITERNAASSDDSN